MPTLLTDLNLERRKLFLSLAQKRAKAGSGSSLTFLNQRTWTFPVADIRQFIPDISFVVVGGVATRLYMPERMTLDLDIVIAADQADIVYQRLQAYGAKKVDDLSIPGSQWELPDCTSLDVLEIDEPWIEAALSSPNYAPDGLPIIDLPYLILMKLNASRSQDLADISRMLGGATDSQIQQVKTTIATFLPTAIEDLESLILLGQLEHQ
ncbi:MAG: hypothetical protein VKL20_02690 [Synechocystis sp.]|nr:hypothetical protein [Synechocystis sp.]